MRNDWLNRLDIGLSSEDEGSLARYLLEALSRERFLSALLIDNRDQIEQPKPLAVKILFWRVNKDPKENLEIGMLTTFQPGITEQAEADLAKQIDEAVELLPGKEAGHETPETILERMLSYWTFGQRSIEQVRANHEDALVIIILGAIVVGVSEESGERCATLDFRPQLQVNDVAAMMRSAPKEMS